MTTKREMEALEPYLNGMRAATTADELEAALQKDQFWSRYGHGSRGMRMIETVRIEEGRRIRDAHPMGHLVPRMSGRNTLSVAGRTTRIARGGNSAGVRYAWTHVQLWAIEVMVEEGLSLKAAHAVWEWWGRYPHRAVRSLDEFLAGGLRDPELNVLIRHEPMAGRSPIRYSHEENESGGRASRPCPCGGTLFDWGCGHSSGLEFVEWRCIACPDVFTEYMTKEELYALRSRDSARQAA